MTEQLVIAENLDGIVSVRLSNGTANALTTEVLSALSKAIAEAVANDQAILLCGGEKFFSSGVDIGWALGQDNEGTHLMFLELGNVMLSLLEAPVPVVGAIRGHVIGDAKSIFLACDYRYAAVGRVLVGAPSGKVVKAEDAVELGLVHEVAPAAEIEDVALKQLRFLNKLARPAFAESKNMRVGAFCADVRAQMSSRVARQVEVWNSKEAQLLFTAAAERLRPPASVL